MWTFLSTSGIVLLSFRQMYFMKKILVLHGPNLNLLGLREPHLYGSQTLNELNAQLEQRAEAAGFIFQAVQHNSEGELIDAIHQAYADHIDYLIINPAAFTHTSIAMRDALMAVRIPFIEVHLSNIYAREPFRRHSYFSDIAAGVITGLGGYGYHLALNAILNDLTKESN
jgi:3-dehydroquinate dehydratase-2